MYKNFILERQYVYKIDAIYTKSTLLNVFIQQKYGKCNEINTFLTKN